MMCSSALNSRGKPAVSPMSGAPTFDIEKRQKRGEFKTPPRPTGRRSKKPSCFVLAKTRIYVVKTFIAYLERGLALHCPRTVCTNR